MLLLTNFQTINPRFCSDQQTLLNLLARAHLKPRMRSLFSRCSASSDKIAFRWHEFSEFTDPRWQKSDIGDRLRFYKSSVDSVFERFYPADASAPHAMIHVTCTGYAAPSGAQKIVSQREWGRQTQVLHAYHMGCYASHPATRIAAGLLASSDVRTVDVVHTELCSLHFDPTHHDPAQVVIQSLFADGFIRYGLVETKKALRPSLELLRVRDEIIEGSADVMNWETGPSVYEMRLSKNVPALLATAIPRFVRSLFEEQGLDFSKEKKKAIFAIHPGGPRIIDLAQKALGLRAEQVRFSRQILRDRGNMSSATLPYIWKAILESSEVPSNTLILSLGAGPGLTLSGALFRKK